MIALNFPKYKFKLQKRKEHLYIFCSINKKYYPLTPEEWVRQNTLQFLIHQKSYKPSCISIEQTFELYGLKKRIDILVYKNHKPHLIVECKSPYVTLSQKQIDQINRYHLILENSLLMLTNGLVHLYFYIDPLTKELIFLKDLPK